MDHLPQLPPDQEPLPSNDVRDYITFFFACVGIVTTIIVTGLGIVGLWELM